VALQLLLPLLAVTVVLRMDTVALNSRIFTLPGWPGSIAQAGIHEGSGLLLSE
jgi:hypothetical protein